MRVASRCSATFLYAVVAMIAGPALLAGEIEESFTLDDFESTFVPAVHSIVEDGVSEPGDPPGDEDGYPSFSGDSCSCSHGGGLDYMLIGRGGTDYFSVPGESLFGALYGVDLAVHLAGDWGFVGSANVNHVSHGTQFVGSTGLVKLPDHQHYDWSSPLSFSMVFDQFTDSRVDGLYLNQLRFQLG